MSIYDTLNDKQKEAVFHTEGPLLILAGAGSGKTRVLTHRIAYLIEEQGVNPYNILAITFTNKAAKEMRERVDKLVGFGSESIWVSTFHSCCVRILRRYIDRIGYDNHFTIYDTDDQKTVMKEICKKLQIDTKQMKERSILARISSAKDELLSPAQFMLRAGGDFREKKIGQAYMEYEKTLKKNNALDFDDLIVKTIELFQTDGQVLAAYQERFRYIMVDEYQDTNTAQFVFVSMLANKYENLCVVGDDDQSIYKFRGANIGNILNFEDKYRNAKVIKLEQNYRSTGNILDAANAVISNNRGRKDKALWTQSDKGTQVVMKQVDNAYGEAEYVARDIKKKLADGTYSSYADFACLYRTNAQSRALEEKMLFMNIPYKIVGGTNFYSRREIKDVLAYLKTVDNGNDDVQVRRIINVPKRGIGATSINKIQDYAYNLDISFFEALKLSSAVVTAKAAEKINHFVDMIGMLRAKLAYGSLMDWVEELLDLTGYMAELKADDSEEGKARVENVQELLSKVADYEDSCEGEPTLSGFLEEVALVADIDNLETERDYVTLMTIHSAKGLEFPQVYLCGMEDGLFPSYMSIDSGDPTDLEEERRLCYVAITRAEKGLTLLSARMRMVHGETRFNTISRFVKEIPRELLDTGHGEQEVVKRVETNYGKPPVRKQSVSPMMTSFSSLKKGGDMKSQAIDYVQGDRVKHIKFGVGTVLSIEDGGRDYEVTVDFDNVGVKKMFQAFAKLQKV
jgi:DNA helicase-2/ATP-dependent DNA helicase PcrA